MNQSRFWSHLGRAYFTARRYDEAIKALVPISTFRTTRLWKLVSSSKFEITNSGCCWIAINGENLAPYAMQQPLTLDGILQFVSG